MVRLSPTGDQPTGSKWCPSCGDEYEERIVECLDCGVPLVPVRPQRLLPAMVEPEAADDAGRAFDLADLSEEDRAVIALHLEEGEPLPHQWLDELTLMALPGYVEELEQVVDRVRRGEDPSGAADVPELAGEPASLGPRAVAAVVDMVVAVGLGVLIGWFVDWPAGVAVAYAADVTNHVLGFGTPGRSIGKRVIRATILRRSGTPLTMGEAFLRWLIRDSLAVVVALVWWTTTDTTTLVGAVIAAIAFRVALVGTIVVDVHHRGLHDLAIDSAVYQGSVGGTDDFLGHAEIIS